MKTFIAIVTLTVISTSPVFGQRQLLTVAESSDFQATAHYADVIDFCRKITAESDFVHQSSMGKSFEGRELPLLILADPPIKSPAEAKADPRPVVFAMANIHAGEVCGKEALLMLARDMARNKSSLLEEFIIVFAPIYNADGNERFAVNNRPNQIGPAKGMGQRPNAQGFDLNRDHMKLESPEAQALAKLMTDWDPVIAIDCHTTNGSWHRYALTFDTPRHPATDKTLLEFARDQLLPEVSKDMESATGSASFFYGNFSRNHDEWQSYPAAPRYSTHYFGLRNSIGILSEAYAYDTYKQRVESTYAFVEHTLKVAAKHKAKIESVVASAKQTAVQLQQAPIQFKAAVFGDTFTLKGYKEESAGGGRAEKPGQEPVDYTARYFGVAEPTLSVKPPFAYLIPADQTAVLKNLKDHGVATTPAPAGKAKVTTYAIESFDKAKREFQTHRMISAVQVTSNSSTTDIPAGTVMVRTSQPLSRLIVNLLEPQSADGLCAWNFFDQALEAKVFPIQRVESRSDLTAAE